jgi:hypothetical protein
MLLIQDVNISDLLGDDLIDFIDSFEADLPVLRVLWV